MLRGVHTALVTPFDSEGVALETFRSLCHRQVEAGIHGLVPCGTTGETPTLTADEWAQVIQTAVEVADGSVPVTAGCGTNATPTTVENIQKAQDLGADAALVVLPYYNKPNPRGHIAHLQAACAVGLPVVAYHVPGRTGQRLPAEQLAGLANLDGVIAVKEATGDVHFGSEVIRRTDAAVLSGDDFTFYPLLCVGGSGVISVVSNVDPARTIKLYEAATSGDLSSALELHQGLMDLVDYLFTDTNPVPCKAAMAAMGLCESRVRLPLVCGAPPPESLLAGVLS